LRLEAERITFYMIVMKFGGSSVESGDAISRLATIVNSHIERRPVVVVSAMGKSTDGLLEFAEHARRGDRYLGSKCLDALQDYHFEVAGQVADGDALHRIEKSLQRSFRDLRMILFEAADEGRQITPALLDEIASFGERMSSEIVAAALECRGIPSIHLDARQVIVTDNRHTHATPLYWESYARLRRIIPHLNEHGEVVVLGGFIGATEDGVTTTLGRGGSDLTASIAGVGISAEEIQIWTDVDGMLTCDPRVVPGAYRLLSLSYREAATLAASGAKVLHPDTVTPAIRQRIPIVIRNSRRPDVEGTQITALAPRCSNAVKAIACKPDLTVLEIQPKDQSDPNELAVALAEMSARHGMPAEFVCQNNGTIFLALKSSMRYESLPIERGGCVEVRLHPQSAILTLVGEGIDGSLEIVMRTLAALRQIPATILSSRDSKLSVSILVPSAAMQKSVEMLHREFFQKLDPAVFAEWREQGVQSLQSVSTFSEPREILRPFRPLTTVNQN
jgi:aspartate kinase